MRRSAPILFVLGLVVSGSSVAGCSESDEVVEPEPVEDADSDAGADADPDEALRERIAGSLEAQGFAPEAVDCIIDHVVEDEGFTLEELQAAGLGEDQDAIDAVGRAGAACLDAEDLQALPAGSVDLSDPVTRDQFVKNFASNSGLSIEVGECVVDFLIEEEVDPVDLAELDEATLALINEAVEGCV